MLNSVVKISMMSAKYFEYYTIILGGGRFFVDIHCRPTQISCWIELGVSSCLEA